MDWIEVEVRLQRPSNGGALRRFYESETGIKTRFIPIDPGDGAAATRFRFRIQEPSSYAQIVAVLHVLDQRYIFSSEPIVTGIEVALDTYRANATVADLASIAVDRYQYLTSQAGDYWYFYRDEGEGRRAIATLDRRHDLVRCFEEQWQLTDRTSKSADVRYHLYVKTRDAGRQLKPHEYRARLEVTLRGTALPCVTLDQLQRFDFSELAMLFKFRRLADDIHPALRQALADWSKDQHGMRGKYRRPSRSRVGRYAGTSVFKRSTVADSELNSRAYESLRQLSRKWRCAKPAADFPV